MVGSNQEKHTADLPHGKHPPNQTSPTVDAEHTAFCEPVFLPRLLHKRVVVYTQHLCPLRGIKRHWSSRDYRTFCPTGHFGIDIPS